MLQEVIRGNVLESTVTSRKLLAGIQSKPSLNIATGYMFCCCFLFVNNFFQTNYLNIYQANLRQIFGVGKTLKTSAVSFHISARIANIWNSMPNSGIDAFALLMHLKQIR